jgi:ElaA protein
MTGNAIHDTQVRQTEDLAACHALRRAVFIAEQGVSEADEMDGLDGGAIHLLAWRAGQPVGTARLLHSAGIGKIGRVCVLAQHRGVGVGMALMQAAIAYFQACPDIHALHLGAQTHAVEFYARLGFVAKGAVYLDADIPHRDMVLTLPAPPMHGA